MTEKIGAENGQRLVITPSVKLLKVIMPAEYPSLTKHAQILEITDGRKTCYKHERLYARVYMGRRAVVTMMYTESRGRCKGVEVMYMMSVVSARSVVVEHRSIRGRFRPLGFPVWVTDDRFTLGTGRTSPSRLFMEVVLDACVDIIVRGMGGTFLFAVVVTLIRAGLRGLAGSILLLDRRFFRLTVRFANVVD